MRILHLSNHCIFGNGNVHAAVDLACEQSKQGHDVFFASSGGDFESLLEQHGVRHIKITHPNKTAPWLAIPAALAITELSGKEKIEIIHAHMMTGAVLGWAATRLLRIPLVTTVHNAFDRHAVLMGWGDRVIAVSEAVKQKMVKRGIPEKKISTVLNGTLGTPRTIGRTTQVSKIPSPSIITVCGLHDRKGVRHLIEGFNELYFIRRDAHLYIIGEGPQELAYKALAKSLPSAANIHFLGQLRDPRSYLAQADIFVLASLQDPCPLVIPEAMEMGCAIVATNVDGIPEMLAISNCGILVRPENSSEICNAIAKLINEPDMLKQEKSRSIANLDYFRIERVSLETIMVYKSTASKLI